MKIKELLNEESKWRQGSSARDRQGNPVSIYAEEAVRWCLAGAARVCYPNMHDLDAVREAMRAALPARWSASRSGPREPITSFNDKAKFGQVKEFIEKLNI
jgi:hypothetical protein